MKPLFVDDQVAISMVESNCCFLAVVVLCIYFATPSTYICTSVLTGANARDSIIFYFLELEINVMQHINNVNNNFVRNFLMNKSRKE